MMETKKVARTLCGAALAVTLVAVAAARLWLGPTTVAAETVAQQRPVSPCRVPVMTTITAPGRQCDPIRVGVRISVTCPASLPLHLAVVVDRSSAMSMVLSQARQAGHRAVSALDFAAEPRHRILVLSHGAAVRTESNWTSDPDAALGAISGISYRPSDASADPGRAVAVAHDGLRMVRDDDAALEAVLLIGAGCPVDEAECRGRLRQEVAAAADSGIQVIAVCFSRDQMDCGAYRDVVTAPRLYLTAPGLRVGGAVDWVLDMGRSLTAAELALTEYVVTSNFRYVVGSGTPVPKVDEETSGLGLKQVLTFRWRDRAAGTAVTADYECGHHPTTRAEGGPSGGSAGQVGFR